MELHSIILLIAVLSVIGFLTYFINRKQKKKLQLLTQKQEPRFDIIDKPNLSTNYTDEQTELYSDPIEDLSDKNLLADDPLMQPKSSYAINTHKKPDPPKRNKSAVEEIIFLVLNAKANKPYVGYELLQSLLASGLRYGAMNIFHRHEDQNGNGKILFSLASSQEPGTFEIGKMGAFSGQGLMMFLRLSTNKDLMSAFDIMLETAKQLIEDLDGEILDDERKILSPEKIEKIRKKIQEFEQKQLTGDLFD